MKKVIILFVIFILLTFIYADKKSLDANDKRNKEDNEMKALFVSYIELDNYIRNKNINDAKTNIETIIKNTKNNMFNTIIVQVRSHDDAIYNSKLFRTSSSIILDDGSSFDVLKYFIDLSKKYNIKVYVWINPYRASRLGEELDNNIFASKYKNTDYIKQINGIYYYNPAKKEIEDHIIDGITEIIDNYDVNAILFDDYFYPSTDIDIKDYEDYLTNNKITIDDYHLNVINNMIKRVYNKIKSKNKNILFGISPDGNIENNYNKNFADVKLWCSSNEYIDFIMPQLYYGFYNSVKPFKKTAEEWSSIVTNKNIKLYYAFAFYKVGKEDYYAKEGKNEWILYDDIIKKQIIISRNISNFNGFGLFRYDNLFNKELYTKNTINEIDNLKSTLKK